MVATMLAVSGTVLAYLISRSLFLRYQHPLCNVVLLGTALVISGLLLSGTPYEAYIPAKEFMTLLLGPATVALAIPLYKNRQLVQRHSLTIALSVGGGALISMSSAVVLAEGLGLGRDVAMAAAPKSITAPIAIEIARLIGGDPALATAFVVATGTLGSAFGPAILTRSRISGRVARGLALGTVAHAQGVGMALAENETAGAMASCAMAIAAVFLSAVAPLVLQYSGW